MVERAPIKVLVIDDSESDVTLAIRELRRAGLEPAWERVATASHLRVALASRHWDVVVASADLPQLGAFEALMLTHELAPSTSFVALSATLHEAVAVDILRAGAADFVTKHNLPRLSAAIMRELARPRTVSASSGLSAMLVAAQEAESRRIASNLHDRLGQLLVAIARALDEAQLAAARELTDEAIGAVREISTELWPSILDDLGLPSALRWIADRYASRVSVAVRAELDEVQRLPSPVEAATYRIAEAALANVARHAEAREVVISLRRTEGTLELEIRDDGRGFDLDAAWRRIARGESLGLSAMRERATLAGGTLMLATAPGAGTTVRVRFPLESTW